jgi:hypothetical protein
MDNLESKWHLTAHECNITIRLSSVALLFRTCLTQSSFWLFMKGTSGKTHQLFQTELSIDSLCLEIFGISFLNIFTLLLPPILACYIKPLLWKQYFTNSQWIMMLLPLFEAPVKYCVKVFSLNLVRSTHSCILSAYRVGDIWGERFTNV